MKKVVLTQIVCCIMIIAGAFIYRYTGDSDVRNAIESILTDSILVHRIEDNIARVISYVLIYIG